MRRAFLAVAISLSADPVLAQQTLNIGNNPPSTAQAPAPAFSSDACGRSYGLGLQSLLHGFAVGLPVRDRGCERRATARLLKDLGEDRAAVIYLSDGDPDVAAAVAKAHQSEK